MNATLRAVAALSVLLTMGVSCTSLVGVSDITFVGDGGKSPGADASSGGRDGGRHDADASSETVDAHCTSPKVACGSSCVDPATFTADDANCGACGHSCVGGKCASSRCQPFMVSTARTPNGIAVGQVDVFWTDSFSGDGTDGTVMKAPLSGGAPVTLVSEQETPFAIAIDTNDLYWTNLGCPACADGGSPETSGSVMRANLDGSNAFTLASGQNQPASIALGSPFVYWTTNPGNVIGGVAAAGMTTLTTVASTMSGCAFGVAVCGTTLFWADPCDAAVYSVDTTMPNDLSPGIVEGSGVPGESPFAVACNESPLPSWANAGGSGQPGGVFTYSAGNGDGMELSQQFQTQTQVPYGPGVVYPDAIVAVDETTVYWADTAAGTVAEASMLGGKVTTLASGQSQPFSIGLYPPGATTATRVYWVNRGTGVGTVMGVAR